MKKRSSNPHSQLSNRLTSQNTENKLNRLSKFTSIIGFIQLYSETPVVNHQAKCIIHHGNTYKIIWDLWVLVILLIISLVVPYRLAFDESDNNAWFVVYLITDCFFLIDIILTFFTTVTDEKSVTVPANRW